MNKLEKWLYALAQTVIGGAATAGSSGLGMTAAKAVGLDVPTLNFKALGLICLSGAVTNLFFFLKASPLPTISTGDTAPPFTVTGTSTPVTKDKNPG